MSHDFTEVIATSEVFDDGRHWVAYATLRGGIVVVNISAVYPQSDNPKATPLSCWWQPYDLDGLHSTVLDEAGLDLLGMTRAQARDLMSMLRSDHRARQNGR